FVLSDTLLANALHPDYLPAQSAAVLLGSGLIGFSLVRHRLLEVNVFVSRHVVYHSLTVGAVGTYLLAMGVAGWVMRLLDITLDLFLISLVTFVTAMALMIGLLSESVRLRVKRTIARHFYRHKYDYRKEWTAFTGKLASVVNPEAIASRLVATLVEAMGIRKAALFLAQEGGGYRLADSVGGLQAGELIIDSQSPLVSRVTAEGKPLVLTPAGPDDRLAGDVAPLHDKGFTLLVPLVAKEEVLGLLAVGPPLGSSTSQEDEELLATVAAQGASALLNARLAEQLAQARELEALNRVSSFILHDLKNCVSMLSLVTANAETVGEDPLFQRDAFRAVAESVRKMRELIGRLSHLPKGLELRLAPMDLNDLVREGVEQARRAGNGRIRLSTEINPLPVISGDPEQIRKVLDNLLLNALEAIPADGEIRVRTTARNGSISLEVSDNGPGIPETILRGGLFTPFRTTKPHGFGIGLFQVKSIVEAHGGHIHVATQEGKGTTIEVQFPAPTTKE
ncbi:MAG: XrtA/PEP-CTERM system histidine kinase PrsK, partial [Candidatus Rokuibacteriota bacterium]